MKIVFPIMNHSLQSELSPRFARAPFFAVVNKVHGTVDILENSFFEQARGAGKKVFQMLVKEHHVDAFAAYELGLKVHQMATKYGIQQIILNSEDKTLNHWLLVMCIEIDK